ncbi:BRF1-domain-containing protein [Athelia psychrophila]|uniref:B-related factor 1 n=1 Tax=Athelia psychrophila TaxID=1759441 RepID=A0A166CFI4_9AGAM|nr:BRF1-domain-containing protein [Fibularhizoctonia sp. CBS 109695]
MYALIDVVRDNGRDEGVWGGGGRGMGDISRARRGYCSAICSDCGGTVIEYDSAAGSGFCVKCGTVVEESAIVSEVTFGETSGGAAMVQGSYVGQGSTHARMSGPFGNRGSNESREQTIANASRKIQSLASVMRLSETVCLAATRLYTLAVEHKFTKGRKSLNVVAVCLYVACRQKETRNYMLIDFSDLLQFGEETQKVSTDAVRLIQRFDRDWMTKGRRPAGICGAALLLAARMNNFRRSVEEVVQVVKIADSTVRKRLDEFKGTRSGGLTVADFRSVWLEDEMDPPAFVKGKEKEERERVAAEEAEAEAAVRSGADAEGEDIEGAGKKRKRKKEKKEKKTKAKKRKRGEETEEEEAQEEAAAQELEDALLPGSRQAIDPALLQDGILAGAIESLEPTEAPPLFLPDDLNTATDPIDSNTNNTNIDPSLLPGGDGSEPHAESPIAPTSTLTATSRDPIDEAADDMLAEEVSTFLQNQQGAMLSSALDEAEARRRAALTVDDELLGLDEDELDRFLLSDAEVKIKERVWVELNKEYLEALAAKGEQAESGTKTRKRRKPSNKPRDASTPSGSTAAESVQNLIKKNPKYSKRINYNALKDLFVDPDQKDPNDAIGMYTMEGEGEVIEEGGAVQASTAGDVTDGVMDDDADGEEGSEKGDDIVGAGWEDVYEQEA